MTYISAYWLDVAETESSCTEQQSATQTCDTDWDDILLQRNEEKIALESIYEDKFSERIVNKVWTISLDIPKLTELARDQVAGVKQRESEQRKVMDDSVCKYYLKGRCKFGKSCRFKHEVIYKQTNLPVNEEEICDFQYQLEVRFPANNRYPLETPFLAFQSTNTLLPTHVSLNVTSRLMAEAKEKSQYELPLVFTLISLLDSDEELTKLFCMPPSA